MNNTRVILLVVYSVIYAAVADDATIVFNMYMKAVDDYQCAPAYQPIIVEDNATSIQVYVNSSVDITRGFCFDLLTKNIQLIKTNHNTFVSQKQYVFEGMDHYIWTCYVYGMKPRTSTIVCETLFHLRIKTPMAHIYFNSNKMAATRTSRNLRDYDAAASYYFKDDETLVIDCKRSQQLGYSKITYYSNTGEILLDTDYSPTHVEGIHIKLTQESHSNYVDCYYKIYVESKHTYYSYEDVSVTRIFFMSQSADNSVNNFASKYWIWISGGIVMIVIIIIVIVYTIKNFRNKRKMRQSNNMDYVKSPNNGHSPLPHPSQWNDANYTKLIEPEMYSEPGHENRIIRNKKSAKKINNETSKNVSDSDYANVDNSRNVDMEPALNYADILTVNNEKHFEIDAANYSQVRLTGTNISGSNYENVSIIPDPTYVNSLVDKEEAEPAYCEAITYWNVIKLA